MIFEAPEARGESFMPRISQVEYAEFKPLAS